MGWQSLQDARSHFISKDSRGSFMAKRLITGLVVALLVSCVFTFWLSKKFAKPVAAAPVKVQYVAAAKNLDAGEVLTVDDLKMVEWPTSEHLDGAFNKADGLVGRVLLFPLPSDQPIVEKQLTSPGSGNGMQARIPAGMRAISLKSDEVMGVAGFMTPGTHVDVLVTFRSGAAGDEVTQTVLQDVQILAVDQKSAPDPQGKPTTANVVTLLVNPDDAEKAVLAAAQGSVHFVLRNGTDHDHVSDKPVMLNGKVDDPTPKHTGTRKVLTIEPVVKPYEIETVEGTKKSTEKFQ
jgi:pilus assembly protein CpaB